MNKWKYYTLITTEIINRYPNARIHVVGNHFYTFSYAGIWNNLGIF